MINQNNQKKAKHYFEEGIKFLGNKNYEMAEVNFLKSLNILPKRLSTLSNLFFTFINLRKFKDADNIIDVAISFFPNEAELYFNKAYLLELNNNTTAAIDNYNIAIKLNPRYYEAYLNYASLLDKIGNYDEAIKKLLILISINSIYTDAFINLGLIFNKIKNFQKAVIFLEKAIEIKRDSYEAFNNLAIVLFNMRDFNKALKNIEISLKINKNYGLAYMNRSLIYKEIDRPHDALADIQMATTLMPDSSEAYYNQGCIYADLNFLDLALSSFCKAKQLSPNYDFLPGIMINMKMRMCKWNDYEKEINVLNIEIQNKKKCSPSFEILSLVDDLKIQYTASETYLSNYYPVNTSLGTIPLSNNKKIKIGYFSGDFREHALSYLIAELLEIHDRKKFYIIGFTFGIFENDLMFQRLSKCFDNLIDVSSKTDKQVAEISRSLEVDIAVDLMGLTRKSRCGIFSYRAAPLQTSYLGFLGTMASGYHDYIFADKVLIPNHNQKYFSEKIIYLPTYQVNDTKKLISKHFTRGDFDLPQDAFVFCCFNNNYKFNPLVFDIWMFILKSVPNSVLFLYAENKFVKENLKAEAANRCIDVGRLKFGDFMSRPEYLSRLKLADLFLDTFPYSAGVTCSDALWVGLPVLTCTGQSFASRMSASLLEAIEIPELITHHHYEYQATAIELALNPSKLLLIKQKLSSNRFSTQLFNTPKFANNIEKAYEKIHSKYRAGLRPEDIYIEDN